MNVLCHFGGIWLDSDTILMENLAGFYFLLYEYDLTGILYYNGTK